MQIYYFKSFSHPYGDGPSTSAIMDPWDHVLPGRARPLHHVHDPFHGRSRGQDRTVHQDSVSSAPPSEGHPAVAAFRQSKLSSKFTPTTFYTYDGRIASTLNSYNDDPVISPRHYGESSRDVLNQGHQGSHQGHQGQILGRDGRTYYYGRQQSNQSQDSEFRELGATASGIDHTPTKQHRKLNRTRDDSIFQWHSTPIRQSAREPRQPKPSLPRANSTLRRSSLDNSPSPKESLSWAGVDPHWRSDSEMSSKRRSGSYDELETRNRKRYDRSGDGDDGLAVFNWLPNRGPVISIDHNPSST